MTTVTVRAVVFDTETVGQAEASSGPQGLDAWLGGGARGDTAVRLEVLRPRRLGFLVQRLPGETVEPVWWPRVRVASATGRLLCRYHEGPRGEPWRHRYCTRTATTRDGYCIVHRRSAKALYERCAQGVDEACAAADRLMRGEEFTVYALDYGGPRVKIGLTQGWRLIWRIAEQPHVTAAAVATFDSLIKARGLEKRLGRAATATEGAAARLEQRLRAAARMLEQFSPQRAAYRLAALLASLGLQGEYRAYTVLPASGAPSWAYRLPRATEPPTGEWRLLDYWGGLLLLEAGDGRRLVLPKRSLVHLELRADIEPS